MYEKFQNKTSPSLIVEALFYKEDGSNQSEVVAFLASRVKARAIAAEGTKIIVRKSRYFNGDLRIHPGSMVVAYPDRNVSFMGRSIFDSLFQPFPAPTPLEEETKPVYHGIRTYRRLSDTQNPFTVYAMQYDPRTYILLRDMLSTYGATLLNHVDNTALFLPDAKYIEVFNAPKDSNDPIIVRPGDWVTITRRDNELPFFSMYNTSVFHTIFAPHDFTKKDTMTEQTDHLYKVREEADRLYKFGTLVPSVAEETEYTKNRNKVYDALAIVRGPEARDLDFEILTNDLMKLLADAYNEGFDLGLTTAETNPYQDWA